MKNSLLVLAGVFGLAGLCFSASPQGPDPGRKAELRSCTPCHSVRLIQSQRLPAGTWGKEVDKMIGWGAIVPDKQLLLDYLSSQYSDCKPIPVDPLSGNGVTPKTEVPSQHN